MAHTIVPSFLLVGAPKAGTTAFVRYLEQHPSVFVSPIKEPCFFAPEVADFGRAFGVVTEWDQYLKLFKGVRNETAIGEASVSYLASPGAAAAIHARVPEARILMMLRDPADRLWSHYRAAWVAGATTDRFADWADAQTAMEQRREPRAGPVWAGFYGRHLRRFLEHVPAGQIKVLFYDDYVRDAHAVLRDTFAFLGVDREWKSDVSRRHNVTREPRWPRLHRVTTPWRGRVARALPEPLVANMRNWWLRPVERLATVDERAHAIAIYADDIRALPASLRDVSPGSARDLSRWLDPSPPGARGLEPRSPHRI
jgi:hypothetical protein